LPRTALRHGRPGNRTLTVGIRPTRQRWREKHTQTPHAPAVMARS
jgi:hypothetical protein